jgi:hypothetical protein
MGHRRGRPTGEGGVPLHSLMAEKIEALSMNLAGLCLRAGARRGGFFSYWLLALVWRPLSQSCML